MLSKWKALNKDKSLPLDGTAKEFQYRHYINWEVPLVSLGMAGKVGTGDWHIQLITPDGVVIFEQAVTLKIMLISLGSFGLQLFTWMFNHETIDTTIIGGAPVDGDAPAWKFTLGGTAASEFGTMEQGGGTDYTDVVAYVTDWWDSPVYLMTIPPGTKLKVVKDSWGLGAATRPEWQWRFTLGTTRMVDCKFGPFGELIVARQAGTRGTVEFGHSWPSHRQFNAAAYVPGSSEPSIVVMPSGRRYVGLLQQDGYWEYVSRDMERSWEKAQYPSKTPGETEPVPLFGPEVRMPQLARVGNTRIAMAVKGNDIKVRRILEDGVGELLTVGSSVGTQSYALDADDSGKVVIIDDSGVPVWESHELGRSWQPVLQDVQGNDI